MITYVRCGGEAVAARKLRGIDVAAAVTTAKIERIEVRTIRAVIRYRFPLHPFCLLFEVADT